MEEGFFPISIQAYQQDLCRNCLKIILLFFRDYVATNNIYAESPEEYKEKLLSEIYVPGNYRKITKAEACIIQGYPENFRLPEKRQAWMKLLGNSVSVPVIEKLGESIVSTGVFD